MAQEAPVVSDPQATGADAAQQQRKPRRRRRSSGQAGAQRKPETPSVADQLATGEVAVKVTRRRPGDGGGSQRAKAAPDQEAHAPEQRKRRRRTHKPRSPHPQDGQETS